MSTFRQKCDYLEKDADILLLSTFRPLRFLSNGRDTEKQVSKSKKSVLLTHAVWAKVAWTALRLEVVLSTDVAASRERPRV